MAEPEDKIASGEPGDKIAAGEPADGAGAEGLPQLCSRARLVFGFNTFLVDLLMFVKAGGGEALRKRLKARHRFVDRRSDKALVWLAGRVAALPARYEALLAAGAGPEEALAGAEGLSVADGVTLAGSWIRPGERSGPWLASLLSHARVSVLLAMMFNDFCADVEAGRPAQWVDGLFTAAVQGLQAAGRGEDWQEALTYVTDDDYRERLRGVLASVSAGAAEAAGGREQSPAGAPGLAGGGVPVAAAGASGLDGVLESLRDSSLGKIAMELSESVDQKAIRDALSGGGSMEEVISGLLTGKGSGLIGDLLQKVSGTVMSKVQDGSVSLDVLMKEAGAVMGAFGGQGVLGG